MDSYKQIENLIYTYAEHIDAGDLESMSALFAHADFIDSGGKVVSTGAEEFLAIQRKAVRIYPETGTPCTKHVITNVIVEVDEPSNSATARSYFTVFQSTGDLPLQPIIAGRYLDRFECVNGHWRFRQRQTIPELIGDLSKHLLFDLSVGRS